MSPAGGGLRDMLHLGLAFLMAGLIAAMFMGLRATHALIRWFALGGLLWLMFLIVLTPADYLFR